MKAHIKTKPITKHIVVANWKMNPGSLSEARSLFVDIRKEAVRRKRVETIVAVPFVYLSELHKLTSSGVALGAQNVSGKKEGTHTGEISAAMLVSVGVSHVIVGHSERRARGEDDEAVARKVSVAIREGLVVVLCIGESERDSAGQYLNVIEQQLRTACASVPKTELRYLTIAYEPVWAISTGDGKGHTATLDDIHEMTIFIRKILTNMYVRTSAERVRILYGGSVNEENALALMQQGMVDGFLVGGASLNVHTFASILIAANASSK